MKNLLLTALLAACSFVQAESVIDDRNVENLRGATFCISTLYVRTADALADDAARSFSSSQFAAMQNRLQAYRIPVSSACTSSSAQRKLNIYVNFDGTRLVAGGARGYKLDLSIWTTDSTKYFPSGVTVYGLEMSGVLVNYNDAETRDYMASKLMTLLDAFAADYAKANP